MTASLQWLLAFLAITLVVSTVVQIVAAQEEEEEEDYDDYVDDYDDEEEEEEVQEEHRDVRQLIENVDYRLDPVFVPNFAGLEQCNEEQWEDCRLSSSEYSQALLYFNPHTLTVELNAFIRQSRGAYSRHLRMRYQEDADPVFALPPYLLMLDGDEPRAKVGVEKWTRDQFAPFLTSYLPFKSAKAIKAAKDEL